MSKTISFDNRDTGRKSILRHENDFERMFTSQFVYFDVNIQNAINLAMNLLHLTFLDIEQIAISSTLMQGITCILHDSGRILPTSIYLS